MRPYRARWAVLLLCLALTGCGTTPAILAAGAANTLLTDIINALVAATFLGAS